ncbi:unnamed protein product [Penicillium olsonii]|nr:unnamed protein product [Penicillium olsonii]CAG7933084.1 unnamed protein product [Penicillium olsonii]
MATVIRNYQADDRKLKEMDNRLREFQAFMGVAMETKSSIEYRNLASKYSDLLDRSDSLKDSLRQAENDLAESRERQNQAKDSLRDAQESAFRFQDQPQWAPDSDDVIRHQLKGLEKEAKAWCSANSIKKLSIKFPVAELAHLPGEWEAVLRFDTKVFVQNDQHLPQLILQALLMDCVYGEIFAKPFFFLPWRVQSPGVEAGAKTTVRRDQYEAMAGILEDPEEGNSWRCNFLRLLDPRPRSDGPERPLQEATKKRTEMAREAAANGLMQAFLNTSAAYLISSCPLEESAAANLQKIFVTAAHLSYKLWLRKSYLEVQTIKKIQGEFGRDVELLRAHSLHNALLEDKEAALDGAPIRVVVHPGLTVHGSSDGSNYETTRVWKEAVVWMGN